MRTIITLFILSISALAQTPADLPDQVVAAGASYNQQSSPALSGFVAYGKIVSRPNGIYSYTLVRETSIKIHPTPLVQTQTETGVCGYLRDFGSFHLFACGTGGISTVGGNTGVSGSGQVLITHPLKGNFLYGFAGGPSYSGAAGVVQYPVSLVLMWGAK